MYLSTFSVIVPILIGAIFRKTLTAPLSVLYIFICVTGLIELISSIFFEFGLNNIIFFEIFTYVEFISLSLVYFLISDRSIVRTSIVLVSSAFLSYLIWGEFSNNDRGELNTERILVESCILTCYSVNYLLQVLFRSTTKFIETQPYFILSVGLLLYFLGNILVFLFYNNLEGETFLSVWSIHSLLNLLLNFTFGIVLWKSKKA